MTEQTHSEHAQHLSEYEPLAAAARNQIKITAIKAMQLDEEKSTLIKIETDAGISGYGECHGSGAFAREA
ncbi:MAG TPA: hypothetical protein VFT66_24115, partial [Roseiflexaceae bacterium]|nr:hypothetical protein [Roseiflexaceae bacterium]